jgi:hypothetical protein
MSEQTELEALVAKLSEKVADLERRVKPPEPKPFVPGPVGPTTTDLAIGRLSMSPEAQAEMVRVVDAGDLMRDLRSDARRTTTLAPLGGDRAPKPRGSGWRNPAPLSNPPGVGLADKLMDKADEADRFELAQRLAEREVSRRKAGER